MLLGSPLRPSEKRMSSGGPGSGAGLERQWIVEQEKAVDGPVGLLGRVLSGATSGPQVWPPAPARLGRSCSPTLTPTPTIWAGLVVPQRCLHAPGQACGAPSVSVSLSLCRGSWWWVTGVECRPWCGAGWTWAVNATGGQQVEKESQQTCGVKEAFGPLIGWQ